MILGAMPADPPQLEAPLNRGSAVPLYEQIRRRILRSIEDGRVAPGEPLPPEPDLATRYGVSRAVVRQALGELEKAGRLYRVRGRGTFVARPKLREQFMHSTVGFFEDLTLRGHVVTSRVLSCRRVPASLTVAEALELPRPATCIELARVRSVDGEVVTLTKSYLPDYGDPFLGDLRRANLAQVSLYHHLHERWGMRIDSGRRSIEALLASAALARTLDIRVGDPVIAIESVGRDAVGRPVEYFQAWHRGDRARIEIDVVRTRT
jgi:GntR family transcriptional regulator